MPEYPAGNPGRYPIDPSSEIGMFRYAYGDTSSTAYDPVYPGYQNYSELSDAEIQGFLLSSDGSVNRAIGRYYMQLAGKAALAGRSVKDHDLQIDTRNRASDLRALAEYWFGLADEDDAGSDDAFLIVPTGATGGFIPEGAPAQWGRQYTTAPYSRPYTPSFGGQGASEDIDGGSI